MSTDEQAIRHLVDAWHRATAEGNVEFILSLMAPDVVFLTAGQPPMQGRDVFGEKLRAILQTHRIESAAEIQEVQVSGDMAYCWSKLHVRIRPNDGS